MKTSEWLRKLSTEIDDGFATVGLVLDADVAGKVDRASELLEEAADDLNEAGL